MKMTSFWGSSKGDLDAELRLGDMREVLKAYPDAHFDTVITDPPYHLTQASRKGSPRKNDPSTPHGRHKIGGKGSSRGFMGKVWDGGRIAHDPATWREVLRVTKPGGYLLCFSGTRTFHRAACAVEDAEWVLVDCLMWLYGQGFPKSFNIAKAIDKADRGVPHGGSDPTSPGHGKYKSGCSEENPEGRGFGAGPGRYMKEQVERGARTVTAESSLTLLENARPWFGWGTALKPAWEPIILAMRPTDGTYAASALKHGVAGLNINGCRVGWASQADRDGLKRLEGYKGVEGKPSKSLCGGVDGSLNIVTDEQMVGHDKGRHPANLILQHAPECVRVGEGQIESDGHHPAKRGRGGIATEGHLGQDDLREAWTSGETVGFWACVPWCPVRMVDNQTGLQKDGKAVRHRSGGKTCHSTKKKPPMPDMGYGGSGGASRFFYCSKASKKDRNWGLPEGVVNDHPTVKPLDLCRWLARLTKTPTGGRVLDPFCGSGSIPAACLLEGRSVVGVDEDPASCELARHRMGAALEDVR